jgi:hypothetical protein
VNESSRVECIECLPELSHHGKHDRMSVDSIVSSVSFDFFLKSVVQSRTVTESHRGSAANV